MEPSVTPPFGSGSTDTVNNQTVSTTPIEVIVKDFAQYRRYCAKQRDMQGKNAWNDELEGALIEGESIPKQFTWFLAY